MTNLTIAASQPMSPPLSPQATSTTGASDSYQREALCALSDFNDDRLSTAERLAAFSTLRQLAPMYEDCLICEIDSARNAIVATILNPETREPSHSHALAIPTDIWDKERSNVPNTITGFDAETTKALFKLNAAKSAKETEHPSVLTALLQVRTVLAPEFKMLAGTANPFFAQFFPKEHLAQAESILRTLDQPTLSPMDRDKAWRALIRLANDHHQGFLRDYRCDTRDYTRD